MSHLGSAAADQTRPNRPKSTSSHSETCSPFLTICFMFVSVLALFSHYHPFFAFVFSTSHSFSHYIPIAITFSHITLPPPLSYALSIFHPNSFWLFLPLTQSISLIYVSLFSFFFSPSYIFLLSV